MKIGFAVSDITPELGIYLTGYGRPERLATGVHSPLTATAMVMNDHGREAVVIGLDWCFTDDPATREIRGEIARISGIPEPHILLCCSHTHSAPQTAYRRTLGRTAVDPEGKGIAYVRTSIPAIADAVLRAKSSLHEAEGGFAAGKTRTGVSRRGMDENGQVRGFIADPDAMYDDNMTAVRFRDRETHEDIGILIHCSAHNTSMGANRNISSDWCGIMRERLKQRYQAPVLFLNGAFGDVGPRTNRWMKIDDGYSGYSAGGGDGPEAAAEVGFRAASDALRLLDGMRDFRTDLPLKLNCQTLRLPQEIHMTKAEAEEMIRRCTQSQEKGEEPPLELQLAESALKAWGEPHQPELILSQTLIAVGPLALAPFPFEMFSIFSLRLRKFGPFQYTLLCGNANGSFAYLPDRGAIACGGYEVSCRKWTRPYVTKPEAGDLAVTQALQGLREMQTENCCRKKPD